MSVEEIRDLIGADSLAYISEAGLARAIGLTTTCLACFDGSYPAGHPGDHALGDEAEEHGEEYDRVGTEYDAVAPEKVFGS